MLLSVQNNLDQLPQTLHSYLTSSIVSGGTALPVRNLNSFTSQYAVQIGKTGEEQSEIVIIGAPSGTILPLNSGTLIHNHPLDTPVYQINYDQIVFSRSTTGTAGTASALATVSITPDSIYTEYNDTSGAATYAYKTQYKNSVTGAVSSQSDWFTPSGPSYYSLQKMRDRVRKALYNASFIQDDTIIDDWINEWIEDMTNAAIKVNQAYSVGTADIAFGTAGLGTITTDTFKQPIKVELTYDGVNFMQSAEIPYNAWSAQDSFSTLYPRHYWIGDATLGVLPFGNSGTARIAFAKRNTPLVNETDELPFTLRSYTKSCVDYSLFRASDKDNQGEKAERYFTKYKISRKEFLDEITPRDQSGIKFISFDESLSGLNDDMLVGDYI